MKNTTHTKRLPNNTYWEKDARYNLGRLNLFKSAVMIVADEAGGKRQFSETRITPMAPRPMPQGNIDNSDGNKRLTNYKKIPGSKQLTTQRSTKD